MDSRRVSFREFEDEPVDGDGGHVELADLTAVSADAGPRLRPTGEESNMLESPRSEGGRVTALVRQSTSHFDDDDLDPGDVETAHIKMTTRGCPCLPFDLIFERVRSRFLQSILIFMSVWLISTYQVLRTDSFGQCANAHEISISREPDDAGAGLSGWLIVFGCLCAVMALCNSLYMQRGCCATSKMLIVLRVITFICAATIFVQACYDLSKCRGGKTYREYCGSHTQPQTFQRFMVDRYQVLVDKMTVVERAKVLITNVDLCSAYLPPAINDTTVMEDCEKAVDPKARQKGFTMPKKKPKSTDCQDWQAIYFTCRNVQKCYRGFQTRRTTEARAAFWFLFTAVLLGALVWDNFLRVRCMQGRAYSIIDPSNTKVYNIPYFMDRLGRRVPLAILLAWITNVVWTIDSYEVFIGPVLKLLFSTGGVVDLVEATIGLKLEWINKVRRPLIAVCVFFLASQFVIFTLAMLVNLRIYWRHSNELAALDWDEYLRPESTVFPPRGWQGVDLTRFRIANQGSSPLFYGAAWASLHFGTLICSIIVSFIVLVISVLAESETVRHFSWFYVIRPTFGSILAYVLTTAGRWVRVRLMWGTDLNKYPRRVGWYVFSDVVYLFSGYVGSVVAAVIRLLKSMVASMIGIMSVTSPGAHEISVITDGIHDYYLEVLWVERFKLEVDRGMIEADEPDLRVLYCMRDVLFFVLSFFVPLFMVWGLYAIICYALVNAVNMDLLFGSADKFYVGE